MAQIPNIGHDDDNIDRLMCGDTWDGSHPPPAPVFPRRAITPEQKRLVMERVLAAWNESPQLRLGQLIDGVIHWCKKPGPDLYYIEDTDLAELLENWRTK